MKSIDLNVKDAQIKIAELSTAEEIQSFIEGDDRKTVTDAAEKRIHELKGPKQGETGKITKDAGDFKEGIQKTKSVITCGDVLASLRGKGLET